YLRDISDAWDFFTPNIATIDQWIELDPELVEKHIRAAAKGNDLAIDEQEKAGDLLIESVRDLDEELVKRSQEWLATKYQDDAEVFGIQETERWEKVRDFMIDHALIKADFDIDQAFTNDFLPKE